jgi:hypothetical protein
MFWIWRKEQSKERRKGRNFKTCMKKRRRYRSSKRLKLRFKKKEKLKLDFARRKSANVSKNKKFFDNKRSKNEKKKEKSKELTMLVSITNENYSSGLSGTPLKNLFNSEILK